MVTTSRLDFSVIAVVANVVRDNFQTFPSGGKITILAPL
jgi:hypothetical protein